MKIEQSDTHYIGLFGVLGSGGEIKNVTTKGIVNGCNQVGGVCGRNDGGTIINCCNIANVSGYSYVGGVCGFNNGTSTIANCFNTAEVRAINIAIGGVCGKNAGGTVKNCYYDSTVYIGELCSTNSGTITDSCGLATALMTATSGTEGALVDKLNLYVNEHPDFGLLKWKTGEDGYPCFDLSGTENTGSVLSDGNLWIIIAVAVLAIGGVAALVVVKKKKKPALASGADNTDE